MSQLVVFEGTNYLIPTTSETSWATTVTNILADVGANAITLTRNQTLSNKTLKLNTGAVAAPSLAFAADTATGLYQPAANQLALPLEKRDPRQELTTCRRFYRTGNMQMDGYNQAGGSAAQQYEMSEMRTTPTVTATFANQSNCSESTLVANSPYGFRYRPRDSDGQLQRRWQLHRDGGFLMTKRKPGARRELSKSDGTVHDEDDERMIADWLTCSEQQRRVAELTGNAMARTHADRYARLARQARYLLDTPSMGTLSSRTRCRCIRPDEDA